MRREARNWSVAPIDLDEIEQVFAYRLANEVAAARIACAAQDRSDCETLSPKSLDSATRPRRASVGIRSGWNFTSNSHACRATFSSTRAVRDAMQPPVAGALDRDAGRRGTGERVAEHAASWRRPSAATRGGGSIWSDHIAASRDRLLATLRDDRRGLRARGLSIVAA